MKSKRKNRSRNRKNPTHSSGRENPAEPASPLCNMELGRINEETASLENGQRDSRESRGDLEDTTSDHENQPVQETRGTQEADAPSGLQSQKQPPAESATAPSGGVNSVESSSGSGNLESETKGPENNNTNKNLQVIPEQAQLSTAQQSNRNQNQNHSLGPNPSDRTQDKSVSSSGPKTTASAESGGPSHGPTRNSGFNEEPASTPSKPNSPPDSSISRDKSPGPTKQSNCNTEIKTQTDQINTCHIRDNKASAKSDTNSLTSLTEDNPISYRENKAFSERKHSIHKEFNSVTEEIQRLENNIINQASVAEEMESSGLHHNEPKSTEELAAYIQSTLSNLQTKFTNISDGILSKVDNMSGRIDSLERSIAELMTASGVDITENSLTPRH